MNNTNTLEIVRLTARPYLLAMSVAVVLAGTACARMHGEMELLQFMITLVFAVFTQLMSNFLTRYYATYSDSGFNACDELSTHGDISEVRRITGSAATASGLISAMFGAVMISDTGLWVLIPGVLIYGIIYLSCTRKSPFGGILRGLVVPFLLFGIIGVGGAAQIQIFYDNPHPFAWHYISPYIFTGVAMGFLAINIYLLVSRASISPDADHQNVSFTARYGEKATVNTIAFNGLLWMCSIFSFIFTQHLTNQWVYSIVAVVPFLINSLICVRLRSSRRPKLFWAYVAIDNFLLASIMMLTIALLFGDPDSSRLMYT